MGNELEFPYHFKGRHALALMACFTGLPAFAFWLSSTRGDSPSGLIETVLSVRYGFFALLVPLMWLAIPFRWFRTRGEVLRLNDSELRVGKVFLPVHELDSIQIVNSGFTRSMVVHAGKRKAAINQMFLPGPKAFDEIVQALKHRPANRGVPPATREVPSGSPRPANAGAKSEPVSTTRGRTAACEAIRQKLRLAVMYDEEKIDRLVGMERQKAPRATDEQLHAAAYESWCRDNRT